MNRDDRPTIPAPPISTKDLVKEWEARLAASKKENGK